MIVVDASVLSGAIAYADERGRKARAALAHDPQWAAPEHWKAEVFSVLRGLTLGGKITEHRAVRAVGLLPRLGIDHVPLDGLLSDMWRLRANISGYDAAYVALAQQRDLTLTTADTRLARTATAHCRIELIA